MKSVETFDEPSEESLREIPPIDREREYYSFRGPGALQRALAAGRELRMGRPPKGVKPRGTATKSVRLDLAQWAQLERLAKERETTVHALIKAAVSTMLQPTP